MANAHVASAPRGVLFGQLLRGGPSRAGPIFDRLDAGGVAHLVNVLSPAEMAMCASLACGPTRVLRTAGLPIETLVPLVRAALQADADRLFASLTAERGAELRRALIGGARDERRVEPGGRADAGLGVVLRLRRLFRR